MADHAKPILTDNYTDVLSQIRGRFEDQAKGFDPANTTATNIVTGTIRWNSAENKFQKWSGTAWGDLTTNYVLSGATLSTGTANGVAYLNGSKVLTTGSALTFDGTKLTNTGSAGGVRLEIVSTDASPEISLTSADTGTSQINFGGATTPKKGVFRYSDNSDLFVWLLNSNTEQMRLTSTGLGIGTSSPAVKLAVNGTPGATYSDLIRLDTSSVGPVTISFGDSGTSSARPTIGGNGNSLVFGTGATTQMRLDANGNLGLGVIPSAWSAAAGTQALQIGGAGSHLLGTGIGWSATPYLYIGNNAYHSSGAWRYSSSQASAQYEQSGGQHIWKVAPSGTAGSPISFTQAMTLDANGNLGLGVTPAAWSLSSLTAFQIQSASLYGYSTDESGYSQNAYYASGSFRYINSGLLASQYRQQHGSHRWFTAPSGTAGSPISFTQAMTLDANGKLILSAANQGIQFADGTTQTTAGINPATASTGAIGTIAMCKYIGTGSVSFGGTKNASELQYSDVTGSIVTSSVDGNIWRCLGRCSDAGNAQRVTIWVRVS